VIISGRNVGQTAALGTVIAAVKVASLTFILCGGLVKCILNLNILSIN
jgi:hypothetical protein